MKVCKFLALALFAITMSFTACGDDESSSGVAPESAGEISTNSSASSSDDDSSSSKGGKSSGSVSSSSKNSSSSAKSSPSTDAKSSSSVTSSSSGTSSSSSSLKACTEEGLEKTSLENNQGVRYICQGGFWVPLPKSSSSVKSSSSYFDMSKQYNDKEWIEYETFVDPRDNQEYRTIVHEAPAYNLTFVVFATNLNYGKMVTAETATYSDETVEKFCYNDDPWYCENGFGGLYTWSEALGLPRACDTVALGSTPECPDTISNADEAQRQGICPEGWHVMNGFEWRRMPTSEGFGAKPMLSQVFGGSDDIGLAVLLGGGYYRGKYDGLGVNIDFWVIEESSDKEYAASFANTTGVSAYSSIKVNFSDIELKLSKLPVRCVKDY